jgi:hypothetical protein
VPVVNAKLVNITRLCLGFANHIKLSRDVTCTMLDGFFEGCVWV